MRLIILVFVGCLMVNCEGKSTKKSIKDTIPKKLPNKSKSSPPAIIAIEIIDPNENKTSSRNSKRTIDSYLGYGYQNYHGATSPPKFEVYKYSQHDIPPYKGPANIFTGGVQSHNFDIQKSISYHLPTQNYNIKNTNIQQYYQPGTTLFSTLNNQGQAGKLSQQLPQHQYDPQVPVIILRVFPSQLADPSSHLHANLPQSHPLASTINSINIQDLLQKYVQNSLISEDGYNTQQKQHHQQQYEQPNSDYGTQQHYQQQHYNYVPQNYQPMPYLLYSMPDASPLLTHENFPKDTHTRVVFRQDKTKTDISADGSLPQALPQSRTPTQTKTIKIEIPEGYEPAPMIQYTYSNQENNDYYNQEGAVQKYYYPQMDTTEYQAVPEDSQYQYQETEQQEQQQYTQTEANYEETDNYHAHRKQRSRKSLKSQSDGVIKDTNK